jgi:hypothetical protein
MTGYRTYIVMFVSAFLVPLAAKHGLNLDADQQAWAVGAIMAVTGVIMRTVTRTPPLQKPTPFLPPPQGPSK